MKVKKINEEWLEIIEQPYEFQAIRAGDINVIRSYSNLSPQESFIYLFTGDDSEAVEIKYSDKEKEAYANDLKLLKEMVLKVK